MQPTIHTESPVNRTYTLGEFFDIWGQRLDREHVGPAHGPVTALPTGASSPAAHERSHFSPTRKFSSTSPDPSSHPSGSPSRPVCKPITTGDRANTHKQPDASDHDLETIFDGSRGYVRDFRDAVAASTTAREVIDTMKAKYPDYGNLTTLEFSAGAAFPAA